MNDELPPLDDFDLPDDFVIPDDLSAFDPTTLAAKDRPELALLVTRVADPRALAALCALTQVAADIVGTEGGAVAMLQDLSEDAPQQAAAKVSKAMGSIDVLLVLRTSGQISVTKYDGGSDLGDVPPGLVLATSTELVEDLIVGTITPAEVPGSINSAELKPGRAMRLFTEAARDGRRRHR